ncbi:molybdopterin synthase sulfur carrier subunit [Micromonospora lupini]|uniref:molybdopterin synthase sulfur carrier subunit n=1 Tax=Micromonospora lupini TaxID=285679 RepID=UPI0033F61D88
MHDVEVVLSRPLARFAGNTTKLVVRGDTFTGVLSEVYAQHPSLRRQLSDADGALLPFVNVYVGADNIRDLGPGEVPVPPCTTVLIMMAVAGG